MDSDAFVRSRGHVDNGFDGNSETIMSSPQETSPTWAGRGSAIGGLEFLFANSGVRIVTNRDHRVVWATTGAVSLASGTTCINFANDELFGQTRHSDALLRAMFVDAERAAPNAVEMLIGPEPSARPELFVRAQIYLAAAHFTVFTIRSLAGELQEIPNLRHLYGLTRAEQQIVGLMVQGRSATEVAHELHKSVLTIRSHLKRAYSKLNVSSKEQLFSTVIKLMVN
jgi:DNA-binding CsgD family transcriptional regulator